MNNSSGKIGERYVLQMLLEQGYTFIDANYHSRFGEIDIIVADDKYIVFVEVKTRAVSYTHLTLPTIPLV